MQIGLHPAFAAAITRRVGLSASLTAIVAHDGAPSALGDVNVFGAAGPVTLVGGDRSGLPGDSGGLFSISESGGAIAVAFDRDGLGDGFDEGQTATTIAAVDVTDGVAVVSASLRVTVRRSVAPPALVSPIPDQTDEAP